MNSSLATLAVFLVAAMFLSQAQAQVATTCCCSYMTKPIPLKILKGYIEAHGTCSMPAIIFVTQRGQEICADPNEQWVQEHMKQLSKTDNLPPSS